MIEYKQFYKGNYVYTFLTSNTHPEIIIPIKALIKEVKWDRINSKYLVKIIKFYDSITFLKKYWFDMNFSNKIGKDAHKTHLDKKKYRKLSEIFVDIHGTDEEKYYVVVDALMTVKHKGDMQELFDKIMFFQITKRLSEIRNFSVRKFYKGLFKSETGGIFEKKLKKFCGDQVEKEIAWNRFYKSLI